MPSDLSVIFGAGPLGRAIARRLVAAGRPVRIVTRSGAGVPGAERVAADAADPARAAAAARGAARVFHCAAPAYHRWPTDFPPLQDSILGAAAQAGAVLVAIENLYGYGVAGTLTEDLPLTATTRKGRTRAAMTGRLFQAHRAGEVQAVTGRASDFIGPEVRASAFGERLWPELLAGRTLRWPGDPDVPHSVTFVADAAAGLIALGDAPQTWGQAWHLPAAPVRTAREIVSAMAARAGLPAPALRPLPRWLLRGVGLVQPQAGELVEVAYTFDDPLILDDRAIRAALGLAASDWEAILDATLGYWAQPSAA